MRNILRIRVLGMLLLALGLFGGSVTSVAAQGTDATPPGESCVGSLGVSAFLSDQVSVPTITFATASDHADDEGADYVVANFELYINGDLSADPFATFSTDNGGAVVIDGIPAGTHTLVYLADEGPDYAWDVTIATCVDGGEAGFTVVTVLLPNGELPGVSDTGSLVVSCYAAEQVASTEFYVSAPINVPPAAPEEFPASADGAFDLPYTGAYVVDRELLVYLNADFSSVPIVLQCVDGTVLLDDIPSGTHAIVDAQTGFSDLFSIESGFITTVVVVFPEGTGDTGGAPDPDTEEPDGSDGGSADGSADGSDDGSSDGSDGGSADGDGGSVTSLPSTGQGGNTTDSSAIVLVLGAMSLVALAGGFAWRQRRSA